MDTSAKSSFGWPIFRTPLLWGTLAWLAFTLLFGVSIFALISIPDKWDKAVAIKVCGGLPIVRREDGTVWLLRRWRAYRVEIDKLECAP